MQELTLKIKAAAYAEGFQLVGCADLSDESKLQGAVTRYANWLENGFASSMDYLKKHQEIKANPKILLSSAQSVLCVGLFYNENSPLKDSGAQALVSSYTRGEDYHYVLSEKLKNLSSYIQKNFEIESLAFVDSAPVFDRFWGQSAGLGWIGKNSMLINRKLGSYFFIGGLLVSEKLIPDAPSLDHCGRCQKCIEACPTDAILPDRFVDSNKCIAYHTIENRREIPESIMKKTGRWIAGCDICQQVCPWNKQNLNTLESIFKNSNPAYGAQFEDLAHWTSEDFKKNLRSKAMSRMKYAGFLRNLAVGVAHSDLVEEQKKLLLQKIRNHASTLSESSEREIISKKAAYKAIDWAYDFCSTLSKNKA